MSRVAVLMGGPSAEAEVSRSSAAEVAAGLEAAGHVAQRVELDEEAATALATFEPDVVFPALHGPPGEDGTVQGFLDILGYPYVGSGVRGSAVAMDKHLAKALFSERQLPVTEHRAFAAGADPARAAADVVDALGERVVIKPLGQGSAIGVTLLPDGGDIVGALAHAFSFGGGALVESFVEGKEITVGVLDLEGEQARAFPVIEILTASDEWYDYENRYKVGASEHVIPAPLSEATSVRLAEIALAAHDVLELRDLSRADFIVTDAEDIVLLEVNTLPGMTPTSLYPDGARAIGLSFEALVDALVGSALRRAPARRDTRRA